MNDRAKVNTLNKRETLAERLNDILVRLNQGEKLNVKSLAEQYQVSEKTIIRDFMRFEAHLPLLKDKGCYALDVYYLQQLTQQEVQQLAQLLGIQDLYPQLEIKFIRELLDRRAECAYAVKGYAFENVQQLKPLMLHLEQAIYAKQAVEFVYKHDVRSVKPYRLVHHQGYWYLAGVEHQRLKTYRLSRMQNLQVLKFSFERDERIAEQIEQDKSIWFSLDKFEVVVKVQAVIASYFLQRPLLPEQQLVKTFEDGSLLLSSKVSHALQIMPLIRYWLPNIHIVSPVGWQEQLEDELKRYIQH